MKNVCIYFQVHHPVLLKPYRFFDIGRDHNYYDHSATELALKQLVHQCYIPANKILLKNFKKHKEAFKVAFSFSGIALSQMEQYAPEAIESFQELAKTNCVEFLSETYSHSLVSLKDKQLLKHEIDAHGRKIEELFHQKPKTFRNTELIYEDDIAEIIAELGFKGMLTEGASSVLGTRSPNRLYSSSVSPNLKLLFRNTQLSNDLCYRFSNQNWSEYPLPAPKYAAWINLIDEKEELINIFLKYETFGKYNNPESGIFKFLEELPDEVLRLKRLKFSTPNEIFETYQPRSTAQSPYPVSWDYENKNLSPWTGNELQQEAFAQLYNCMEQIKKCDDEAILTDWQHLQNSDHFYYMGNQFLHNIKHHHQENRYNTPFEAFINYMNILSDFKLRLEKL